MKKTIFFLLLLVCCLSGCDTFDPDDDEQIFWDFACHSILMRVTDEAGNNLFDAEAPNEPWEESPYVLFNDKTFDLNWRYPEYEPATRYLPPSFLELYLMKNMADEYYLCFGEFSPTGNHHQTSFTVCWPDGSRDEIAFDLYITWKNKREPTVHRNLYFNGRRMDDTFYISIVK